MRVDQPDYSRVFVSIHDVDRHSIARLVQTDVSLAEVIDGLPQDDRRLRDAVLGMA